MSERDQRSKVVRALRSLDACSVENKAYPGYPDIECIGAVIECKWIRRWPKNASVSPVHIDHFTPQQRVWLKRRWRKGGRAFLLLQANQRDWFLFDGETAAQKLGKATQPELRACALAYWNGFNAEELLKWVKMDLQCLHDVRSTLSLVGGEASDNVNTPNDWD